MRMSSFWRRWIECVGGEFMCEREEDEEEGIPPPARAERSDGRPPSEGGAPRPPCKLGELIRQEKKKRYGSRCGKLLAKRKKDNDKEQ
ncbi:unnamed protein product [Sphagnum balticum]